MARDGWILPARSLDQQKFRAQPEHRPPSPEPMESKLNNEIIGHAVHMEIRGVHRKREFVGVRMEIWELD